VNRRWSLRSSRSSARRPVWSCASGTAWGIAGDPDLTGCYLGRHFELEVKTPAGALTRLQEARLAQWARVGAITAVVRSVSEALAALGIEEGAQR